MIKPGSSPPDINAGLPALTTAGPFQSPFQSIHVFSSNNIVYIYQLSVEDVTVLCLPEKRGNVTIYKRKR